MMKILETNSQHLNVLFRTVTRCRVDRIMYPCEFLNILMKANESSLLKVRGKMYD